MKALVAFYSESGNTEKLAKSIYDGINVPGKEIVPISEAEDGLGGRIFRCNQEKVRTPQNVSDYNGGSKISCLTVGASYGRRM